MPKFVSTSLPGTLIKSRKRKLYDHDFSVSHPLSISSDCIKYVSVLLFLLLLLLFLLIFNLLFDS